MFPVAKGGYNVPQTLNRIEHISNRTKMMNGISRRNACFVVSKIAVGRLSGGLTRCTIWVSHEHDTAPSSHTNTRFFSSSSCDLRRHHTHCWYSNAGRVFPQNTLCTTRNGPRTMG